MDEPTHSQVRICTFKGLQALPLCVARERGFFARHALDVEISYATGSLSQLIGLAHGTYDLIQTAPDNVVNFNNNPDGFGLAPASAPSLILLFGGSLGPLRLYAQPFVSGFKDLHGAVLGVDNPTSGFALVLRDLLARNGLELERDYRFVVAGGTSERLDALRRGAIAATILYAPFDLLATESGCSRLAASTDHYAAYASLATAGTQTWVEAHAEMVTASIVALRQALRWIYDQTNAAAVQALFEREPALGVPAPLASRAYGAFVDPLAGFGMEGMLDEAGIQQVIGLRATYGALARPLGRPADYLDLRWYRRADELFKQS